MIKSKKPSKYYRWMLRSKNHMQDFKDWSIDNGFDVLSNSSLERGEVIKFRSNKGFGILYETGFANSLCIEAISKYLSDKKKVM